MSSRPAVFAMVLWSLLATGIAHAQTDGGDLDAGTELDAGAEVDAAVPDAFVPDAFVPDAFVPDAFVPDAFVPDAFVPDAFVPDAFVPDAFVPDAFVADAAPPSDAAVPDAFVPDAAAVEEDAGQQEPDAGEEPEVCVAGCRDGRALRLCVNGRSFIRNCAGDERCADGACVLQGVGADAGPLCTPGCETETTMRRCAGDEAYFVACGPFYMCSIGNCVARPVPDAGPQSLPDAGCVVQCLDEATLLACTSFGEHLVVACNAGEPCRDAHCVAPEPPPDDNPGNCDCTGTSALGSLAVVGLMLRRRTSPRGRHAR